MGLVLVNIGQTFQKPVGVIGQIITTSSILSMFFALVMGILSIRFKPKKLLIIGLIILVISAIGCSYSPNYASMLLFYSLSGIGVSMVTPMAQTLVGNHVPQDERPKAFSWIMMSMSFSSAFIAGPIIIYLMNLGSWRTSYLGYVLPVTFVSLLLAVFGIPSASNNIQIIDYKTYVNAFKEILSNKSAVSCILCSALAMASFQGILVYGISFYVEVFKIPSSWRTIIWSGMAFGVTVGSFIGGRIVKYVTRLRITVLGVFIMGILAILFSNITNMYLSIGLSWLCCISAGIQYPSAMSLTLDQIPRLRGSTMSLSTAASSLGSAFGTGVGGLILLRYGYGILGFVFGIIGILASIVYRFFTIDPVSS
jgi:predicted MFS family arabinose efflux permease